MSTNLNCEIVERTKGEWFYILQDWDCPVNAWDWRQYATCVGPFASSSDADRHLADNNANPGSVMFVSLDGNVDDDMKAVFAKAIKPVARSRSYRW